MTRNLILLTVIPLLISACGAGSSGGPRSIGDPAAPTMPAVGEPEEPDPVPEPDAGPPPVAGPVPEPEPDPDPPMEEPAPEQGAPIGEAAAARFLTQATFGPSLEEIRALAIQDDFRGWFEQQRAEPPSYHLPYLRGIPSAYRDTRMEAWWRFAVTGDDQLRQRVAFALSEIMVISDEFTDFTSGYDKAASYYDILVRNALGNFRVLLEDVTKSEAMARYLSMFRNQKANEQEGIHPDENYAREVTQLFTVGLVELNPDGTPRLDPSGVPIPTYDQSHVENLARVFTGWSSEAEVENELRFFFAGNVPAEEPLKPWTVFHDFGAKTLLGNTTIPAGLSPEADLDAALDILFNHDNVGPFIGRQLIQRLVTSNPTPAYVGRVASVFDDNGQGVRGDLHAVVRAILLDPEARNGHQAMPQTFGKLREPVLRVTHLWRAFGASGKDRGFWYPTPDLELNQAPLRSPSVFNFFRPNYRLVGPLSEAGLQVPEFQITHETSITTVGNSLHGMTNYYNATKGDTLDQFGFPEVFIDLRPWEARASDLDRLIDELDLVFLSGQMTDSMRAVLKDHLGEISVSAPAERLADALTLILLSPEYAIQR